jgi:dihydrofolate reductase
MNAAPKVVATTTDIDLDDWPTSRRVDGDLADVARGLTRDGDVVVAGSLSVARSLAEHGLVDEYRLLTFPTIVGRGDRLFADGTPPLTLRCVETVKTGPTVLSTYAVDR